MQWLRLGERGFPLGTVSSSQPSVPMFVRQKKKKKKKKKNVQTPVLLSISIVTVSVDGIICTHKMWIGFYHWSRNV